MKDCLRCHSRLVDILPKNEGVQQKVYVGRHGLDISEQLAAVFVDLVNPNVERCDEKGKPSIILAYALHHREELEGHRRITALEVRNLAPSKISKSTFMFQMFIMINFIERIIRI